MKHAKWYVLSAVVVAVLVFVAVFWGFPGSSVVVFAGTAAFGGSGYAWPLNAGLSFLVDTAIVWLAIWLTSQRAGRR